MPPARLLTRHLGVWIRSPSALPPRSDWRSGRSPRWSLRSRSSRRCRAGRSRSCAPSPSPSSLAALANPALVQEEREKVKDIVAVVLDRSTSQTLGDRAAMTDRVRAELQRRFGAHARRRAALHRGAATPRATTARACSRRSRTRSPTCRPTASPASILVTDGVVHDIPPNAALLGFRAPLHALVTGRPDERDRQHRAPRGAALRHRRPRPDDPRRRCSSAAAPARRSSRCAATASRSCASEVRTGAALLAHRAHRAWRTERGRDRGRRRCRTSSRTSTTAPW